MKLAGEKADLRIISSCVVTSVLVGAFMFSGGVTRRGEFIWGKAEESWVATVAWVPPLSPIFVLFLLFLGGMGFRSRFLFLVFCFCGNLLLYLDKYEFGFYYCNSKKRDVEGIKREKRETEKEKSIRVRNSARVLN